MEKKPVAAEAFAHGRVNLIGEHTDYNGGWVLPTAIPQKTTVHVTPREDGQVTIDAGADPKSGEHRHTAYRLGEEKATGQWWDYVQGVTSVLAKSGFSLKGFDLSIRSNVPEGSGLSSSAALEVSVLKAIRGSQNLDIPDMQIAQFGQRVENEFVGARVGIMDQMACSFAKSGEALFLDTRDLVYRNVRIPRESVELVIVNSGVTHALSSANGYNQRRAECEKACEALGVESLRELSLKDLPRVATLAEPMNRRAKHVITENERVKNAVTALESNDFSELGRLFFESHASMRDDYEVSVPEIDALVEAARFDSNVFGARLTGGGFGGSIVALVKAGTGASVGKKILEIYHRDPKRHGVLLVPEV
ncbi:MAG: galactokinase [Cryobacterium sp.]|nr:galactokinase [Oligoflexia bacterium]